MIVKKNLKINCEEAFAAVEQSLVGEIAQKTGKKVRAQDLQRGYTYNMKMVSGKQSYDTKVIIKEYNRPYAYAAEFITKQGTNFIRYEFKELNEYQCIASYEETFKGTNKGSEANYHMFGWLMILLRKNRIKQTFQLIEKYGLEQRKAKEAEKAPEIEEKQEVSE